MSDANGWAIVIGAVGVIVTQLASMLIAYKREQAKIAREEAIATRVSEVAVKQDNATEKLTEVNATMQETTSALSGKLDAVATTTDVIHKLTNSGMTEVREELKAARAEIRALQQQRVDDAQKEKQP